ncbi:MAG: 30S ribosomal protein S20 [Leptospiraceae bacterium]|nr:30S ribosomal protein S20 [Leptospiraceae bacterium]MCB1322260.1 30S ribosomal protein S20 [Leptospiraceae bacterium]
MANLKSSKKDIRRTKKRRVQNSMQRARLRTYDKKVRALMAAGNLEDARTQFGIYSRFLDRAGRVHLIHPRQADRRKSRMALLLNKAAQKSA